MTPDRRSFLLAGGAAVAGLNTAVGNLTPESDAAAFVIDHVKRLRPLEVAASVAW